MIGVEISLLRTTTAHLAARISSTQQYNYIRQMERKELKLTVMGKGGSGRQSFIYRAIQNRFHHVEEYDPTGEDSFRKLLDVDEQQVIIDLLLIWDTEYAALVSQWLRNTDATLLVYACNDRGSFEEIRKFYDTICQIKERDDPPVVLVEAKADLHNERQITIEEGAQLAKELNAPFFSTSAKTSLNVHEAVLRLATVAYRDHIAQTAAVIYKKGKKFRVIPPFKLKIEEIPSTMRDDIQYYLFNNSSYSDLTIICNKTPIYLHKPILVSRWASFMALIKPSETSIELDAKYTLRAMLYLFKYIYTGKFEGEVSDDLRAAIMKWEVYTLLPVLKGETVGFEPSFDRLFNLEFMSDIKITFKTDTRAIFAHRAVLCARSEYFRTMYKAGFKESTSATLEIDDCDYDTYLTLLKYYYLDKLEIAPNNFIPLLAIGHRYGDRAVLRHIEKYLQDHLTVDNVCHVILLVDFYALADLRSICEHFIAHRFEKVAKTSAFKKLPQETKTALKASKKPGNFLVEKDDQDPLIEQLKSLNL